MSRDAEFAGGYREGQLPSNIMYNDVLRLNFRLYLKYGERLANYYKIFYVNVPIYFHKVLGLCTKKKYDLHAFYFYFIFICLFILFNFIFDYVLQI